MNLKLILGIARTHLLSRKRQTLIATLGVTFGIAMFVLMISFMTGVNQTLEDLTLSNSPHIHIYNDIQNSPLNIVEEQNGNQEHMIVVHHQKPKVDKQNLRNGLQIIKTIQAEPEVLGVSPAANTQVFFNYGSLNITGTVRGVDIDQENKLYNLSQKVKEGTLENMLTTQNGALVGIELARKLSLKPGDKVYVTTPKGVQFMLKVVGIFQYGIKSVDETLCYTDLGTVQKMLQEDKAYITDINIKLFDPKKAKAKAAQYGQRFAYKSEDYEASNATILVGNVIRNTLTAVVSVTLLVVAGFGIYNIMNMTIYEKMKDIAILKAMGFSGGDVTGIFLGQAIFIGLMGGFTGIALGFILSYSLSLVPFPAGAIIAITHFPVNFRPEHYTIGLVFGVLTTVAAGYFPSRKAAKVDPVTIIRG